MGKNLKKNLAVHIFFRNFAPTYYNQQPIIFTETANNIFRRAIADYHIHDNVETPIANPYTPGTIEANPLSQMLDRHRAMAL